MLIVLHQEALQAALLLRTYIKQLNTLFAQEMEAKLIWCQWENSLDHIC